MKLKNILTVIASSALLFAGCTQEYEISTLDEIKVSQSYICIPADGSATHVSLETTVSWELVSEVRAEDEEGDDVLDEGGNFVYDKVALPEWLTVSQTSGSAGEFDITFSAEALDDPTAGRELNLAIWALDDNGNPTGIKQYLIIRQGEIAASEATCQEVIDGPDGKTYIVTGTCTVIENTKYGNWRLADETGEILIYGTVTATGQYDWESFNIEVGDIVTVQGPKTTYNGTVELVDAKVLAVEKSLLQSVATEFTVTKDGGNVEAQFIVKGNGLEFELPEDLKSWITISNIRTFEDEDGNTVTGVSISVAPNTGDARVATIPFTSSSSDGTSTANVTISQEGSISERTVAEIIAAAPSDIDYYQMTGKVANLTNTTYGNFDLVDATGSILVYGLTATKQESNDKSFASLGIEAGDIVTLIGTRDEYNGTPQVGGPAYYVSHIGHTVATVAEVLAADEDENTYYMVTGKVSNIANSTYGNFNLTDETGTIYVYGLTNAPVDSNDKSFASLGIKEGDTVTLIGMRDSYNGDPQIGGAYYFSHESVAE